MIFLSCFTRAWGQGKPHNPHHSVVMLCCSVLGDDSLQAVLSQGLGQRGRSQILIYGYYLLPSCPTCSMVVTSRWKGPFITQQFF